MAFTASDLTDLESAYSSGITAIKTSSGKSLNYASMSDLWNAIQRIRRSLRSKSKKHLGGVMGWSRGGRR